MRDRSCIVTGANTGIGYAVALALAGRGASVCIVCRHRERGERAVEEVRRRTGNDDVHLLLADLSSPAEVERAARELACLFPALHVLVNNAAVIPRRRTVTPDGLETQFAVNHLSYFALTQGLLDTLRAGAPSRVVNVASAAHHSGVIRFEDLQAERGYIGRRVYADRKLANVIFTFELARHLQGSGVTANAVHPGLVATNLACDFVGMPRAARPVTRIVARSWEDGARTPVHVATAPELEAVSGEYFADERPAPSSDASRDRTVAERLWKTSEEILARVLSAGDGSGGPAA